MIDFITHNLGTRKSAPLKSSEVRVGSAHPAGRALTLTTRDCFLLWGRSMFASDYVFSEDEGQEQAAPGFLSDLCHVHHS